jgi:hypothetical protein
MNTNILAATDTPPFARSMHERVAKLGVITASSSSTVKGEVAAWAVAVKLSDHVFVAAVARRAPDTVVAIRAAAPELSAMAIARSLVLRSGKRIEAGGLCPAHFSDLHAVPFSVRAPQFVVGPADAWGIALRSVSLAVGCTWQEMALDPEAREAAVRKRTPIGLTGDVLVPVESAINGMTRSLRKAKEPLSSNAAWALQSLIAEHLLLTRARIEELALLENLAEERAEFVGALVDSLNPRLLEQVPAGTNPRVVLCRLRLPKSAGGQVVTAYFFDASHAARNKLDARLPETPLAPGVADAGFSLLEAAFNKHRPTVQAGLAIEGALRLQRGFHADASLDAVRDSFAADGFGPVCLVLD